MKKVTRKGIEVLRAPKPCHSKGRDELYRKLTALSARRSGVEVQLNSYRERVNSLTEILQKIRKEETELTNLLRSGVGLTSDKGKDKGQGGVTESGRQKGNEMVFRF